MTVAAWAAPTTNETIRINLQKIIKADTVLQSNGAVAVQYIDALWKIDIGGFPEETKDASDGGNAELSSDDE